MTIASSIIRCRGKSFSAATMAEQVRRAVDFWLDSEEQKLIARYREAKKNK